MEFRLRGRLAYCGTLSQTAFSGKQSCPFDGRVKHSIRSQIHKLNIHGIFFFCLFCLVQLNARVALTAYNSLDEYTYTLAEAYHICS